VDKFKREPRGKPIERKVGKPLENAKPHIAAADATREKRSSGRRP